MEEWASSRSDLQLILNSHVHKTDRIEIVRDVRDLLRELDYKVIELDAASWQDELAMHDALASAFDFPDYYDRNLDALNDVMRGVAFFEYGSDPSTSGTALVLRGFEDFASSFERAAHSLLDVFASQARTGLLADHPMLCLVEASADRSFDAVGATPVMPLHRVPRFET